ncbi:hypothetical protein GCM10022383_00130 [Microbacterium soli]|uniref:Uncharacterized protein n=1 Tax=Microbacterium soli TaxID=446075 RepID=A0ABP7MJP5_9MICO
MAARSRQIPGEPIRPGKPRALVSENESPDGAFRCRCESTGVLKEISTEDIYDAAKALAEGKTITVAAN